TPAVTTRGMKESEMIKIADLADRTLSNLGSSQKILEIKKEVHNLTSRFGMYDC
ncbi:MAG TPA: serine hydroxymethyltransferase, partial [Fusobacteria bacterium]|nr:serine hydroxymethyltransferase [Fusobacteriota bacterium]